LLVAEAASRGVRYDKYFAIGKFSRHIFNRRLLSAMRAKNNLASLPIFFLAFLPQWCFIILQDKLRETITCRPILSGGCDLSHGSAVIDLSLEQPERAQGFLDPVCTEIARLICW
jgi:hypothetical protein